jgi:hypothetical protein
VWAGSRIVRPLPPFGAMNLSPEPSRILKFVARV